MRYVVCAHGKNTHKQNLKNSYVRGREFHPVILFETFFSWLQNVILQDEIG